MNGSFPIQLSIRDTYIELGVLLEEVGELDKAIKAFQDALEWDTDSSMALFLLGKTFNAKEDFSKAETNLLLAIQRVDENETLKQAIWANLAISFHGLKKYEEAVAIFEKVEKSLHTLEFCLLFGESLHLSGKHKKALSLFNKALKISSNSVYALIGKAQTLGSLKKFQEANEVCDQAIAIVNNTDPLFSSAIASKINILHLEERYSEAANLLDLFPTTHPDYSWAIANKAELLLYLGKDKEALALFEQATEIDKSLTWVFLRKAEILAYQKNYKQAIEVFDQVVNLDPNNAKAIFDKATLLHHLQFYDKALEEVEKALELDKKEVWRIATKAHLLRKLGYYQESLKIFNQLLEQQPNESSLLADKAETLRQMGHYEEALPLFDEAIKLNPSFSWAIARRGEIYRLLGRYKKALTDINFAIKLIPDEGWYLYLRAKINQILKHYEKSKKDLLSAIEKTNDRYIIDPQDVSLKFNLGLYHLLLGENQIATNYYKEAILLDISKHSISETIDSLKDALEAFPSHYNSVKKILEILEPHYL